MRKVLLTTLLAVAPTAIAQDTLQEWTVFPTFASNSDRFADIREPWVQCAACHGAMGQGGIGPTLAGQEADEIISKLMKYRRGEQVGPQSIMMYPQAQKLTEGQIGTIGVFVQEGFPAQ